MELLSGRLRNLNVRGEGPSAVRKGNAAPTAYHQACMKSLHAVYAAAFSASLATLAACGPSSGALSPAPAGVADPLGPFAHRAASPDRRPSWASRDAKGTNLLYVSDVGTGDVYMYSYPGGKLQGTLTGFMRPAGLCADAAGDVYIPDLDAAKIYVYRHGAEKATRVLQDPGYDPGDCSVDPTSGDLAVSNVSTFYTGQGDVAIYRHAKGKPKKYRDAEMFFYYFCGYDNAGNLYVDGADEGNFVLAELPGGQSIFTSLAIDQTIRFGGGVQWDGQYLAVGDYDSNLIYQFSINGGNATKVGKTPLVNSNFAIGFWLHGTRVIGANDDGGSVMYWDYPTGGSNVKTIGGLKNPWGVTLSLAK